jgi:hypothetical protein
MPYQIKVNGRTTNWGSMTLEQCKSELEQSRFDFLNDPNVSHIESHELKLIIEDYESNQTIYTIEPSAGNSLRG